MSINSCVLIGVVLCAGVSSARAETHVVQQDGLGYSPADIVVQPGDTVEWHWNNGNHPMASGDNCEWDKIHFEFLPLDSGNQVATFVVPSDGTTVIPYYCIPHCSLGMVGTITIDTSGLVPVTSSLGVAILSAALILGGIVIMSRRRTTPSHG